METKTINNDMTFILIYRNDSLNKNIIKIYDTKKIDKLYTPTIFKYELGKDGREIEHKFDLYQRIVLRGIRYEELK